MSEEYSFFPDEVKNSLPKLYSQEQVKDPIVYAKWFCPWNQWTWFATEGEQQEDQFICFGYVIGHEREWGYFSITELESITGPFGLKIERNIYFTPRPKSKVSEIK
ncbi:MAG: DUF2958 domain-containing protein [Acidobacteriota bacterium]